MGRENTIRTGTTSYSNSRSYGRGEISNEGQFVNIGIGKVLEVFSDKSIQYLSLNNSYGTRKSGTAFPFDKNLSQVPTVGNSVLLIGTPKDFGDLSLPQFGSRSTFYMSVINPSGYVGGTVIDSGTSNWSPSVSRNLTTQEQKNSMLFVKDYLKNKGLSKEASAGIMGNIMVECSFDYSAGVLDVNNLTSVGLIQWNGKPGAQPGQGYDLNKIPLNDLKGQLDKIFDGFTIGVDKYLNEAKQNPSGNNTDGLTPSGYFAYVFAKEVEVCAGCISGIGVYRAGTTVSYQGVLTKVEPFRRSVWADDFIARFNDPTDSLSWNGVQTPPSKPPTNPPTNAADTTRNNINYDSRLNNR